MRPDITNLPSPPLEPSFTNLRSTKLTSFFHLAVFDHVCVSSVAVEIDLADARCFCRNLPRPRLGRHRVAKAATVHKVSQQGHSVELGRVGAEYNFSLNTQPQDTGTPRAPQM
jgi:hypothetical protein